MNILITENQGFTTLSPIGELDANSSVLLDEKIEEILHKGIYNLHIECSKLTYISSAGLGVFISYLETLKTGNGKFVFSGMSEGVYKVFELLGLPRIMSIVSHPDAVNKEFEKNGAI